MWVRAGRVTPETDPVEPHRDGCSRRVGLPATGTGVDDPQDSVIHGSGPLVYLGRLQGPVSPVKSDGNASEGGRDGRDGRDTGTPTPTRRGRKSTLRRRRVVTRMDPDTSPWSTLLSRRDPVADRVTVDTAQGLHETLSVSKT